MSTPFSLKAHDIEAPFIGRNMPVAALYEEAIRYDPTACISGAGALVAYSGEKTGRSPNDKRIVRAEPSAQDVWWGKV
ncbi:MAG TPA: phosphoenolpyruvate carboxykinase (ATP), partial [Gemmatales bacterium]|nr:phosphoenolpyruvate carboxykinase (ATP) [Gemmatales bacterium]